MTGLPASTGRWPQCQWLAVNGYAIAPMARKAIRNTKCLPHPEIREESQPRAFR